MKFFFVCYFVIIQLVFAANNCTARCCDGGAGDKKTERKILSILNKLPEYVDADKKLQTVSEQWQKEIDARQAELDKMYKDYDAEQFMLSDDLKKKREDELFNKEKEHILENLI